MKNALFAVVGLLALSFVPVSGHAQMPGEKCGGADKVQVGTTKIATDSQSIIACLLTGNTAPGANVSEWKAMTSSNNGGGGSSGGGSSGGGDGSSSGGGITGGCNALLAYNSTPPESSYKYTGYKVISISSLWGKGCDMKALNKVVLGNVVRDNTIGSFSLCNEIALPTYSCGASEDFTPDPMGSNGMKCICVKK